MSNEQVSIEVEKEHIKPSKEIEALLEEFEKLSTNEERIKFTLTSMKKAISQEGNPDFKLFWESRRLCLPLFKEPLNTAIRFQFWSEYIELSREARRLKDILDEQTSYTLEQIDLAIGSIEKDLGNYDMISKQMVDIQFPDRCRALQHNKEFYMNIQRELNLLNTFAAKINSLRKEIMKTNMRIRNKNKFFQRLSATGDEIFPKRKDYIRTISQEFMNDVDGFIGDSFDVTKAPYYVLREEIKYMQNVAKLFTLNTQAFTSSRLKLSECWDVIKTAEKEYKKEMSEKKHIHKDNSDEIEKKIKSFSQRCAKGLSIEDANHQADEILQEMKNLDMKKSDIKILKQQLFEAKAPITDKEKIEREERRHKEIELKNKKKEKIQSLSDAILALINKNDLSADDLKQEKENIEKEISEMNDKSLISTFENKFKSLNDLISEKMEDKLLNEAQDSVVQLKDVFELKKKRRSKIKKELETCRKEVGGSGFDFEKAMMYREMMDSQKQRLEEINSSLEKLEEKITELESE